MDPLRQGYSAPTNDFRLNSKSVFSEENRVIGYKPKPGFQGSFSRQTLDDFQCEGESSKEGNDHSDATLKIISEMLLEEEDDDWGNMPSMLHDSLALQATEKSLYDALNNDLDRNPECPDDLATEKSFYDALNYDLDQSTECPDDLDTEKYFYDALNYDLDHNPECPDDQATEKALYDALYHNLDLDRNPECPDDQATQKSLYDALNNNLDKNPESLDDRFTKTRCLTNKREKETRNREDNVSTKEQKTMKQLASNVGETEPQEMYDSVLLDDGMEKSCGKAKQTKIKKKWGKKKDVVDLQSLLMQCAQAMANFDRMTVNDLLLQIRRHSSPHGDGTERLAHYFAIALEARSAGTGSSLYAEFSLQKRSSPEVLNAYKTFVTAFPLEKISHLLANKTIEKLATETATLHIVDFGIQYGYQWPSLIQALSERRGGPPKLRITGIDFPQPGFRPAEKVENTGLRLAKYCERFGVPFEYNAIAQKWDTVRAEDLKIHKNEHLVVNILYRLHNVLDDETELVVSPRDVVLNLIRSINPDMFIHGIINGPYNTPFFISRFREALFHYSSLFDMFDVTIPRGDENRLLVDQILGSDAVNTIACEGAERIDRPDTYKLWRVRSLKAGFSQLRFDPKIVSCARNKLKTDYHKDFTLEEEGGWLLHGWKGRVNSAISCWQPAHN